MRRGVEVVRAACVGALVLTALAARVAGAAEPAAPEGPPSPSPTPPGVAVTAAPLADDFSRGRLVESVACRRDPTQTYTLYLPSAYSSQRRWPVLLVFDPGAQAMVAAEVFREAAETYGWIVVASRDARNGPWEPVLAAMRALWPEVHERFASDPRRIYAAGFSGGGMAAELLGRQSGTLAGLIQTGGRWDPSYYEQRVAFAHWGAAGDLDFNYQEMRRIHARLAEWGVAQRFEVFAGRHTWMPKALARDALGWMELQAMREGRRPTDAALVARLLEEDRARAAQLETEAPWDAQERYAAIARSYAGLADVSDAELRARTLATDARVRGYRRDEERWNAWELGFLRDVGPVLGAVEAGNLNDTRLRRDLRLAELERRAGEPGYEGVVARRCRAYLSAQLSFFLPPALFARQDFQTVRLVLELAEEIFPGRPEIAYNRACAEARLGRREAALELLETAVARGWSDGAAMLADADLESLREEPRFRALAATLRASG